MRNIKTISCVVICLCILNSCGPSKAEQERIEKERQDSIARVEQERVLLDQKLEQERQDSIARAERRKAKWATDSVEIVKLLPSFTIINDKENDNKKIYVAKGIPTSHYRNGAYLSCVVVGDQVQDLLLNVDFLGDDNFYLNQVDILIGENSYELYPSGQKGYDIRDLKVAEWNSCEVNSSLADKILDSNTLKIKLIGEDYTNPSKLLNISSSELEKMKQTIRLYNLFKDGKVIL